jgi:hypothetical protein
VSENLSALELEVEQARTKLANDLAVLRSPQPYRTFSADLKSNAQAGDRHRPFRSPQERQESSEEEGELV